MIDVKNLHKAFGDHEVLKGVNEHIEKGEKVVVIGPSGSGKSTFLRCLNLLEEPTSGEIIFEGQNITAKETDINLVRRRMGMVFQQFNLFENMNVMKNLTVAPMRIHKMPQAEAEAKAEELVRRVGLADKLTAYPSQLSGGQKQRIAIVRALMMNPEVMLFDEPTSVLAPHEVQAFLQMLSGFRNKGYGIFLITHKIDEILAVSDRITILRQGEHVCTFERRDGFSQQQIISAMMGNVPVNFELERPECSEENEAAALQLSLSGVSIKDDHDQLILHDVSFEMHKAEILGIAGISGNGQRELAEAIYGARKLQSGILSANEEDISSTDIAHRIQLGMRMVTEDPIRDNVVPTFSILENMALVGLDPIYRHGDMDWQAMRSQLQTHSAVKTLRVPQAERIAGTLSGGNLQRMAFARAVISRLRLLIASYPSRGLDIATVHAVHKTLFRLKKQGVGTILISEDISELFTMCDRILVLSSHTAFGPYCVNACTPNEIGKIMLQGENAHE